MRPSLKPWVVIYTHRYGTDAWIHWARKEPALRTITRTIPDYEPDREDEHIEIRPAELPQGYKLVDAERE